jgi:hypothetical protein
VGVGWMVEGGSMPGLRALRGGFSEGQVVCARCPRSQRRLPRHPLDAETALALLCCCGASCGGELVRRGGRGTAGVFTRSGPGLSFVAGADALVRAAGCCVCAATR